jgi:hypothetical protein
MNNPIALPLKFSHFGNEFIQILRTEKAYIYQHEYCPGVYYYEVFLHKVRPEKTFKGKVLPAKVKYPKDNNFGYWAWCYNNLDKAMTKFLELCVRKTI